MQHTRALGGLTHPYLVAYTPIGSADLLNASATGALATLACQCDELHHVLDVLLTINCCIRWSFGSLLFLSSFAAMMGPMAYIQHLLSGPRLPFSAAYFGSLVMSIYFSIGVSHLNRPVIAS